MLSYRHNLSNRAVLVVVYMTLQFSFTEHGERTGRPLRLIRTCCVTLVALLWPTREPTRGCYRTTWDTRTFSTPCCTLRMPSLRGGEEAGLGEFMDNFV